jgi:hypothetical protein
MVVRRFASIGVAEIVFNEINVRVTRSDNVLDVPVTSASFEVHPPEHCFGRMSEMVPR